MVGFHLKISADLHDFTSKMQITESPMGSKRKAEDSYLPPLSHKQRSQWL
jgi:hypothetical protein